MTYKDRFQRFRPLTEEQQKDYLFMLLDMMDYYAVGIEALKKKKRPTKEEKSLLDVYARSFSILQTVSEPFIEVSEELKKLGITESYTLKTARRMREEYEKEKIWNDLR